MSSEHSNSAVYKNNEPSICIPRTFSNITWKKVKETFEQLFGEGCVDRVDVVKKTHDNGETFNRIFVHFKYWSDKNADIRQRFLNGEELKIVYDEPWFWKCSMSRVAKPTGQKRGERRGPYITSFDNKRSNELRKATKPIESAQLTSGNRRHVGNEIGNHNGDTTVSEDPSDRPSCCSPRYSPT